MVIRPCRFFVSTASSQETGRNARPWSGSVGLAISASRTEQNNAGHLGDPSHAQGERKLAVDGGRNLGDETPTAYRHDFDAKKTPATKEATKLRSGNWAPSSFFGRSAYKELAGLGLAVLPSNTEKLSPGTLKIRNATQDTWRPMRLSNYL